MAVDFDKFWNFGDPAGTEQKFREVLPQVVDDHNTHAELLTQIARTQALQRKFDDAHATLDMVIPMLTPVMARQRTRYLLERGRVFNSSQQPDTARPLFLEAWDLAREAGEDPLAIDAAHMVAITYSGHEALAWNEKALAFAEASDHPRAKNWLGTMYHNIGVTYLDSGNPARALEMFRKDLEWRTVHGAPAQIRISQWCVARALRALGHVDEALEMQRALFDAFQEAGEEDGYVFEELAECLHTLNRDDEARHFFGLAYRALSQDQWFVAREAARLQHLKDMAGA